MVGSWRCVVCLVGARGRREDWGSKRKMVRERCMGLVFALLKSPTCMGVLHAEIQEPSAGFFGLIDVLAFA